MSLYGRPNQYGAEGEGFQQAPSLSLAFPLSDKGGGPLQAESDSESRTCPRSSKPTSKSDRKAKPFLPIQAGKAAPISNHRSPRSHIGAFMMHHDQKAVKKTRPMHQCTVMITYFIYFIDDLRAKPPIY